MGNRLTYIAVLLTAGILCTEIARSQDAPQALPPSVEQQLENLTEANEDVETEDDSYLQDLQQYIKNPVNLNYATESELRILKFITPLQAQQLQTYISAFGKLIDLYELQAIPGWNVDLIRKIRPFVTVSLKVPMVAALGSRLKNGENTLLIRSSTIIEKSMGYNSDSTSESSYRGSPQKLLVRYKYKYKNTLQYGITAEKDAGEQFFKGAQKSGFDFYSVHFFAKNIGIIKTLALGDYTINLGQGLVQWQSLGFKKSSDVLGIKRQADIIKPYNSAGEINFHRGAAFTLSKKLFSLTGFVSFRKIDANFNLDTLNNEDYISSLQTSGYHRTKSEIADKNSQHQTAFGGNISCNNNNFHAGFNAIQYAFKYPLIKAADPYNKYSIKGKSWGNYSFDYSYTFKNMHLFGEAAIDQRSDKAFVQGLLINVDAKVDLSFLYRNISRAYQSLYTNGFTENTFPTNEKGFFAGITIKPTDIWRIDAYADLYHFPWLKFRVDAPSSGKDYLLQLTYKPNKQLEIYSRYRNENKGINVDGFSTNQVYNKTRENWRTQFSYKINQQLNLRSRLELLWYDKRSENEEHGYLIYTDIIYKPLLKRYSGNVRVQYFETDSYTSRLYAYENDVLYSYSIPVFYDKGYRYYINFNYDINKNISVWARCAQTVYKDKKKVGSGLDEIKGSRKSEIKLQLIASF